MFNDFDTQIQSDELASILGWEAIVDIFGWDAFLNLDEE